MLFSSLSFHLVFEKMAGNIVISYGIMVLLLMIGPLLALIQKRERFTEREASLVTKEVANALSFLHEQGMSQYTYILCISFLYLYRHSSS